MRVNDTVLGGLMLVFALALALHAQTFPAMPGQQFGAATFPLVIAAGFAGCGLFLLVAGARAGGPLFTLSAWVRNAGGVRNVAITILAVVFYIMFSRRLGFVPTMALILLVLFRMLNVRWLSAIVLALAVTATIHYAFGEFLRVPLPWGVLAPWRW